MESQTKRFSLFGIRFRIEYTLGWSFDFGITYTNQDYNDEKQIRIGLFRNLWITWGDYNGKGERKMYGFFMNKLSLDVFYGENDYFEEKPGNRFKIRWSRIVDFFLGKEVRLWDSENIHGYFLVKMDYGDEYHVRVISKQLYSCRPRWFGKKLHLIYECTPDRGIPMQGKGTTSYNCGDDATFSMSCSAENPRDAVLKLKESSEKERIKFGMVKSCKMSPDVVPENRANGTFINGERLQIL